MIIHPAGPLTVTAGVTTPFIVDVYDSGDALVPSSWLEYSWFMEYQGGDGVFSPIPPRSREIDFTGHSAGTLKIRASILDTEYGRALFPGWILI
jgi:hypothetical protein